MEQTDLRYLKSLAKQYPTVAAAATEIINLQAILSLPKGTEHFITDIHGEYDQFQHVLKNGSGAIKRKIEDEFGNAISQAEKKSIATLIYYPTACPSRTSPSVPSSTTSSCIPAAALSWFVPLAPPLS